MSLNLNKVVLAGRVTADIELKQTPSGVSVVSFTIAVNRRFVSKSTDAQAQPQADFINVTAWRTTAEFISKYFHKGSAICITGSIQTRKWQDQQGNRRFSTERRIYIRRRKRAAIANKLKWRNRRFPP